MKKTLIAFCLTAMSSSHAGLLVEPYLNFAFGSGESTYNSISDIPGGSGVEIGGRLGGTFLGAMAGLDVAKGSLSNELKVGSTTYKDDYSKTRIGIFAGYEFPILLRGWAAYHFKNELESDGGLFAKNSKFNGTSIEFGIGFTPLPLLCLNAGYRASTYDEFESSTGSTTALNGSNELTFSEYFVGVSLPLDL